MLPTNIFEMYHLVHYWKINDPNKLRKLEGIKKAESVPWGEISDDILPSQMKDEYRQELSFNGITLDILKSCIAKWTRRGETSKLIWAFIELDLFAYSTGKRGETIRTNFIHRAMIAYLEEISISNVGLWFRIDSLIQILLKCRKKRKGLGPKDSIFRKNRKKEEKAVVELAWFLGESFHGRTMSHLRATCSDITPEKKEFARVYFPKIDLIGKTRSHKINFKLHECENQVKREATNFLGCIGSHPREAIYWAFIILKKLKKCGRRYRRTKPVYLLFAMMEAYTNQFMNESPELLNIQEIGRRWYAEIHTGENFMCWMLPIMSISHFPVFSTPKKEFVLWEWYGKNLSGQSVDIDSYVIDMHTRKGKYRGMGPVEFAEEGSKVDRTPLWVQKRYGIDERFYTQFKIYSAIGKKMYKRRLKTESKRFEFRIRAQLTCSKCRGDTYFAFDTQNGDKVFIKGPYTNLEGAQYPVKIYRLKKFFKYIEGVSVKIMTLIPDAFPDVPMGLRTKVDREKEYPFLISEDQCELDKFPVRIHSSKLWPPTEIVDWDKVKTCRIPYVLTLLEENPVAFYCYTLNLLFRWVIGIPDAADRNFLLIGDKIMSIDEEGWGRETNMYTSLRKKKSKVVSDFIDENWETLSEVFEDWNLEWAENQKEIEDIIKDEEVMNFIDERLEITQDKNTLFDIFRP